VVYLQGEINKFDFEFFCKQSVEKGKTIFLVVYEVGKIRTIYQNDRGDELHPNSTAFGRSEIYIIGKFEKSKSYGKVKIFPAKIKSSKKHFCAAPNAYSPQNC
jgi:hypothetical protein